MAAHVGEGLVGEPAQIELQIERRGRKPGEEARELSDLGSHEAIVIIEPDSLAQGGDPGVIDRAVRTCRRIAPAARLYIDAGHSQWKSASEMAGLLSQAGIDAADGFAVLAGLFTTGCGRVAV